MGLSEITISRYVETSRQSSATTPRHCQLRLGTRLRALVTVCDPAPPIAEPKTFPRQDRSISFDLRPSERQNSIFALVSSSHFSRSVGRGDGRSSDTKISHVRRFQTETSSGTLPVMHTPKKSPVFAKVQRAQSVIVNGQHLFLRDCKKCGTDFYGVEKRTRCDECLEKHKNMFPKVGYENVRLIQQCVQ
jgi:predicted Zn-ribbon and HTH transcriptional regulator